MKNGLYSDSNNIHQTVEFEGEKIVIQGSVTVEEGCTIKNGITIGYGARIKKGSVVTSDIPPYAVARGNPVIVSSYNIQGKKNSSQLVKDIQDSDASSISLGIGSCSAYLLKTIVDPRGHLMVFEFDKSFPFPPKRVFSIYGVPNSEQRGAHAHKKCKQFLCCLNGSVNIIVDDGKKRLEILLQSSEIGIYLPEKIWGTQYDYSENAVLQVFASHSYSNDDYIRDYNHFIDFIK